jgi:translocation protein SEC62
VLLAVIVVAFMGLVLFPVWPQFAKVGVWYVSMTLILILFGFITLRLVLFMFLYGMGVDFWILPNFFADDLGVYESFRPAYSYSGPSLANMRETWPYRLVVVAALATFVGWVVTQPTEFDVFLAQNRKFVDELYEGTLLADKSQKDKEALDKLVVPDTATLERELAEMEKEEEAEPKPDPSLEALVDSAVKEQEQQQEQEQEEFADL